MGRELASSPPAAPPAEPSSGRYHPAGSAQSVCAAMAGAPALALLLLGQLLPATVTVTGAQVSAGPQCTGFALEGGWGGGPWL